MMQNKYLKKSHYFLCVSGMLQHYLKNNVLNWSKMCHILQTIASGLVHLHTEIIRGGEECGKGYAAAPLNFVTGSPYTVNSSV